MNAVALLERLVAFDTTSRNSNLAMVEWVTSLLMQAGARIRLTHDDAGTKANVLASFGPDVAGGIVLSAHTDTVPVDGQTWSSEPFRLVERDGRLYGRGAVDMKGFVACCLAAAPHWGRALLQRPIHLALSYDEEVGCFGVPRLIADLAQLPPPALAIVGEPTEMRIGARHRGYFGFRTTFHGRAAHSGDPEKGVSAIAAAARLVSRVLAVPVQNAEATARTTFSVGQIAGGTNINIVPGRCEVLWEIRPAAAARAAEIRACAQALIAEAAGACAADTEEIITIPPLGGEGAATAIAVAQALGATRDITGLPFGTEGGFFANAGIPTVVCGPGSIAQAHQPDEWVAISELEAASRFLARVTAWASA
ncbi:MAG TPA: acetylornithine deacetylase [Xanthobacteraceae bacterium]|nr:acetylornithine deacetylase [Xanthobacteraceae bacterium]